MPRHADVSLRRDQLPLFTPAELKSEGAARPDDQRVLTTQYLSRVLRMVMYHRVATVAQVHREFFAAGGKRRQYCAHVLRSCTEEGLISRWPLATGRRGRPTMAYQITADGARLIGRVVAAPALRRLPPVELAGRVQLTEVIQTRADEGWRALAAKGAFAPLKQWALRVQRDTVVERAALIPLERTDETTAMTFNVLVRGGDKTAPAEARILLQVAEHRNLRAYLKSLPSLYGFPPLVFEIVSCDEEQIDRTKRLLAKLARKRKFRYSTLVAAPFWTRGLSDTQTPDDLMAQARRPAGWEPWLKDMTALPQP